MRKLVSLATKCDKCGSTIEYEKYDEFCDQCGNFIDTENHCPLHMTVFVENGAANAYDVDCCSWKCVRNYFLKNKKKLLKVNFITIPYVVARKDEGKTYCGLMKDFYKEFILCE